MKANSSKKTLWLVSLVLILALLLAVGVSGAWFTASKTGSANVTMGEAVEIELINNGSGWDTIDDTDVLPGSDFVPKVQIKSLSLTHSIIRAKWEFSMLDGDRPVTPKTQAEIDAIADANERSYQQQVKDLFDYYAITQAANMHVKTSGVNVSDQYYIYSAADGYYYFNKVQNSTELLDFTSDKIIVPTTITNELQHHTLRLTFVAESVQILAINSENFSSTGWGEWSNLPTAIQEMIDQYNENPIASAMEDVELADFEYEVVDANSNGSYSEAEGDYILLKRYTGILRKYRVKSHYTIDTDTLLPVVDAGSTSLSTSLATTATLPVKTIGNGVDTFDDKVVNIDLPSTVDTINNSAFAGNTKLENVLVDGETAFTNPGGTISTAPSASEWVGGIYIGYEAFVGTNISNVTIPSGVDFTINTGAFDSNVGFTYNGTKYDTLEDLQNAMTAAGDSITLDTSVLFTPAIGAGGGGHITSYYDPTGEYSYVDSYGTWTFDIDGNTAIIRTYIPADKYNGGEITELTIPSEVTYDGNTYTVVAVDSCDAGLSSVGFPEYYFMLPEVDQGTPRTSGKFRLTGSLTIPASVLKLGRDIFEFSNINTLVVEGDLNSAYRAFSYCRKLMNITANNLTRIYASMFSDCDALEEVSLPKVTHVGENAFYGCTSLSTVNLMMVTDIENEAFMGCRSLTTVNMPNLVEIGYGAFCYCTALSKFNSTTEGVADLHNVAIIEGAPDTSYRGAFEECTSLVSVYFGSNVYIGAKAFKNCTNLTNIYFATTGAASLSAENSQINVGDRDGDGNDDFITASTITDEYSYSLTGTNCNLTVNGSPAAESYAAGTIIDLTITPNSGCIKTITYFAPVLNDQGKYELTEITLEAVEHPENYTSTDTKKYIQWGLASYTISGLAMNHGQIIKVTNEFKVTGVDGSVQYCVGYDPSVNCKDQYGNIYYKGVWYILTQNVTLSEATREDGAKDYVYNVTYMFNDVDVSSELRCNNYSDSHRYIYEHNNFALHLPTYGISNGNKYIAGWTDNNGHTYMFVSRWISDYDPDPSSEYVNLTWATGDVILYPIWENAKTTVVLDGGPNRLAHQTNVDYLYNGFVLPHSGGSYWRYEGQEIEFNGDYGIIYIKDFKPSYNFSAQLEQSESVWVWAEVDRIVGFDGRVININWFTIDTGFRAENSPTSTVSASITHSVNNSCYYLPSSPSANAGWTFCGWVADREIYDREAGSIFPSGQYINMLEPTNWTAKWMKITVDTGYSTGVTSTESTSIVYTESDSYYRLPAAPAANDGWTFCGWVADREINGHGAGALFTANDYINILDTTNWTAKWMKITVDTGYSTGATNDESANVDYTAGYGSYKLPSAPTANEGWYFRGWVADKDVSYNNATQTAGTLIPAGSAISTLENTNWTAVWFNKNSVTFDTGYASGATSTQSASISYTAGKDYYTLPAAPVANEGWTFLGWIADRDVTTKFSGEIKTAGTVISPGVAIIVQEETNWSAKWERDSFYAGMVNIDTGYKSENSPTSAQSASISYTKGNTYYYLPAAPTANEGYIFRGWITDKDVTVYGGEIKTAGTHLSPGSSIYTLEATNWIADWFNANEYTIDTRYSTGATSTESASIEYWGDYYRLPNNPVANEGYYFRGWVADRDVVVGDASYEPTIAGTIILGRDIYTLEPTNWTAVWFNINTITFDTGYATGATNEESAVVSSYDLLNSRYNLPNAPAANDGYSFVGWTTTIAVEVWGGAIKQPGELIYAGEEVRTLEPAHWTAVWINLNDITVDTGYSSGATHIETMSVYHNGGNYYYLPSAPDANSGWTFLGWVADRDVVVGDASNPATPAGELISADSMIFTFEPTHWEARWSMNAYSITYDANGGEGEVPVDSNSYQDGDYATILSGAGLTNGSQVFRCWNTQPDGSGENWLPDDGINLYQNYVLYAQYRDMLEASISYETDRWGDGSLPDGQSATEGSMFMLPSCDMTNNNYSFAGWRCSVDGALYQPGEEWKVVVRNEWETSVTFRAEWQYTGSLYGAYISGSDFTAKYGVNNGDLNSMTDYNGYESVFKSNETAYFVIFGQNGMAPDIDNTKISGGNEYSNYSKSIRYDGETPYLFIEIWSELSCDIYIDVATTPVENLTKHTINLYLNEAGDFATTGEPFKKLYAADNEYVYVNGSQFYSDNSCEAYRDGYNFYRWVYADGSEFSGKRITGDVNLFAMWYNLSLSVDSGSYGYAFVNNGGTSITLIRTPFYEGHKIEGYYADWDRTILLADANGVLQANVTWNDTAFTDANGQWIYEYGSCEIHVKFSDELEQYTITYELDGGTLDGVENPTYYTYGDITINAIPTKPGYRFVGWTGPGLYGYPNVPGVGSNGGWSNVNEWIGDVEYGTEFGFSGAYGNRTYTAKWEMITYTATLNLDGGEFASEGVQTSFETNIHSNMQITLPADVPTRFGYTFGGWSDGSETYQAGATLTLSANTKLSAVWTGVLITPTTNSTNAFASDDDFVALLAPIACGSTITLPQDTAFEGVAGILKYTITFTLKEDTTTVVAKGGDVVEVVGCSAIVVDVEDVAKITLTINHNYGETPQTTTYEGFEGYILTLPKIEGEEGFKLASFNTAASGEGVVVANPYTFTAEDFIIYAIWEEASAVGPWYVKFESTMGTKTTFAEVNGKMEVIAAAMGMTVEELYGQLGCESTGVCYYGSDETHSWVVAIYEEAGTSIAYTFVLSADGSTYIAMMTRGSDSANSYDWDGGLSADEASALDSKLFPWHFKYTALWGEESTQAEQSAKVEAGVAIMSGQTVEGYQSMFSDATYVGSNDSYNWIVNHTIMEGSGVANVFIFEGTSDTVLGYLTAIDGQGEPMDASGDENMLWSIWCELFPWYVPYISYFGNATTQGAEAEKVAAVGAWLTSTMGMSEGLFAQFFYDKIYVYGNENYDWLVAEDTDGHAVWVFYFEKGTTDVYAMLNKSSIEEQYTVYNDSGMVEDQTTYDEIMNNVPDLML